MNRNLIIYTRAGRKAFDAGNIMCALDRHEREAPILGIHPSEWSDTTPQEGEGGAAMVMQ